MMMLRSLHCQWIMSLIGRLFVILFGFLAACLVAGTIVVGAVLFPEFSDLGAGTDRPERDRHRARLRLHLHLRLCAVAGVDRGSDHRGVLYPQRAGLCGRRRRWSVSPAISAWSRSITETLRFDGIVRRHLEIMTGAGIVAGLVYWLIAGRNAGAWREPPRLRAAATAAVAFPAAAVIAAVRRLGSQKAGVILPAFPSQPLG